MNSQLRYELFVKPQKDKNLDVIHLERLIDTRWAYFFGTHWLKKLIWYFPELLEVLLVLSNEGDQTAKAGGILNEISTFSFISISLSTEAILQRVHRLSVELQNSNIIESLAVDLIKSTKEYWTNA